MTSKTGMRPSNSSPEYVSKYLPMTPFASFPIQTFSAWKWCCNRLMYKKKVSSEVPREVLFARLYQECLNLTWRVGVRKRRPFRLRPSVEYEGCKKDMLEYDGGLSQRGSLSGRGFDEDVIILGKIATAEWRRFYRTSATIQLEQRQRAQTLTVIVLEKKNALRLDEQALHNEDTHSFRVEAKWVSFRVLAKHHYWGVSKLLQD